MNKQQIIASIVALAAAAGLGLWAGLRLAPIAPPATTASAEPEPLYWYDPMRPEVRFDKPGPSPFMDMDLVPKYPDATSGGTVSIDPRMVQNLGMRTAPVTRGGQATRLDAVGTVSADERRSFSVESRAAGWVERLMVRGVGERVARGAPLAAVYAPELVAAQEELLLARAGGDATLVEAARARLSRLGMADAEVQAVLAEGKAHRQVALVAPTAGVVIELAAREGMQAAPGLPLFKVADLARVWVLVEVPEAQASMLRVGRVANARFAALPRATYTGRVEFVEADLQAATRTVRARIGFDNPRGELLPGMYAAVGLADEGSREALRIPSEAVIRTGTRSVVILAEGAGRFRPAEVVLGAEHDGVIEILSGLEEGETVVVSGQFLIDSEANLRGVLARLAADEDAP